MANDIMNKIQRGTFKPGEKLPKQTGCRPEKGNSLQHLMTAVLQE